MNLARSGALLRHRVDGGNRCCEPRVARARGENTEPRFTKLIDLERKRLSTRRLHLEASRRHQSAPASRKGVNRRGRGRLFRRVLKPRGSQAF